jgi:hypothetical membrane protein
MLRKILLACGVISSLLYVGADLLAAARHPEYHDFFTQAISELTAVGAPTKATVEPLLILYDLLIIAFGVGVLTWDSRGGPARLVGALLAGIGVFGLAGIPFAAMRMRGTGSLATDAPHLIVTAMIVVCILLAVGIGASLFGRRFQIYSYATLATLLAFGAMTGVQGARLAAGLPTPWLGAVERIHIGAYLLWVAVLAVALLRRPVLSGASQWRWGVRRRSLPDAPGRSPDKLRPVSSPARPNAPSRRSPPLHWP